MKILEVDRLNNYLEEGTVPFIEKAEQAYENELETICNHIIQSRDERPMVLLSGPSGSAKTTSALRMKKILDEKGYPTHVISMDNYFLPLHVDDLSKVDLESPERLDLELIAKDMKSFIKGEAVRLPVFDFAKQDRIEGEILQRKQDEIIILEGIHALNPDVTGSVYENSTGLYVSVRTRLEHNGALLHPSKIRLMRRLMRDSLFRGRKVPDILTAYASVQRGETLYIMPHKQRAHYDIDTFIAYEAAAYKAPLLPQLVTVPKTHEHYDLIDDLIEFLEEIDGLELSDVPSTSLVREFLGGSGFKY